VLVTLDKDFGELAIRQGAKHCGIIRLVGFSATEQAGVILQLVNEYVAELEKFAIVTADPQRVRIRLA
jgi:predicted nuclease of predicted toxin-antitoxin system